MAWLLYQALMALLLGLAAPVLLLTRSSHYLPTLSGRLGKYRAVERQPRLWVHAVSVGEVGVANTLIRALPKTLRLVVTTVTPTGQEVARRTLGDRADVAYFPFDLGFPIRRFFDTFTPTALVIIEGDLWPLVLSHCERRSLPIAVANCRISGRNFRRLRRLRCILRPLFGPVDLFAAQSREDEQRLLYLGVGAEKVQTVGNLKFDTPDPPNLTQLEEQIRELAGSRPILVAGSTMPGEEQLVIEAFKQVGLERATLVIAPRHPERCDEVDQLLTEMGVRSVRRSQLGDRGTVSTEPPSAVLLDTLGELSPLYRLASGAFVGGTLVSTGGHNPLEAARFGVPIAAGPSMENFREIETLLDARKAWRRVLDPTQLASSWLEFLDHPESARAMGAEAAAIVEANRGAVDRTLALLGPLLGDLES